MENIQQPKRGKKKIVLAVLISLAGLIVFSLVVFYFYPIPKDLDKIVKSAAKVERCIYSGGIGYFATYQGSVFSKIMYNSKGERLCSTGGVVQKEIEGPCKMKMCLPIYGE